MTQILKRFALAGITGLVGILSGCDNSEIYGHQVGQKTKLDCIPIVRGAPASNYIGFVQLNGQGQWEYTDRAIEDSKLKQIRGAIIKIDDENNRFQSRSRYTSFWVRTNEEEISVLTARYFNAREMKSSLNKGNTITFRYKSVSELNDFDRSNIIKIEGEIN